MNSSFGIGGIAMEYPPVILRYGKFGPFLVVHLWMIYVYLKLLNMVISIAMLNHQRVIKLRVKLGWVSLEESRIVMR